MSLVQDWPVFVNSNRFFQVQGHRKHVWYGLAGQQVCCSREPRKCLRQVDHTLERFSDFKVFVDSVS